LLGDDYIIYHHMNNKDLHSEILNPR